MGKTGFPETSATNYQSRSVNSHTSADLNVSAEARNHAQLLIFREIIAVGSLKKYEHTDRHLWAECREILMLKRA